MWLRWKDEAADNLITVNAAPGVVMGAAADEPDKQGEEQTCTEAHDDEPTTDRLLDTVLGPGHGGIANGFAQAAETELVDDETAERDGVAKELQRGDGGVEPDSRHGDDDNIFEHTAQGDDERRGFAHLQG